MPGWLQAWLIDRRDERGATGRWRTRWASTHVVQHRHATERQPWSTRALPPTRRSPVSGSGGILLFDGVDELDAIGPWEVLSTWTQRHPEDGWETFCLSPGGRPVRGAKSLPISAHHCLDKARPSTSWSHPGGPGTGAMLDDTGHLGWIREMRTTVPLLASVSTGSLVYAAAGLLIGRKGTAHRASPNLLSELDPTITTDVRSRFVDDGDLITSAGLSAGIDMALHLLARSVGTDRAQEIRRVIQYGSVPPS